MSAYGRHARRVLESEAARPLLLVVAVLVLWHAAGVTFRIPKYLIPAPYAEKWLIPWHVSQREDLVATP